MAAASVSLSLFPYPITIPPQIPFSSKSTGFLHWTLRQSSISNNNIGSKARELAVELSISSSRSRRLHVFSATTDKANALPFTETVSPATASKSVFNNFLLIPYCFIVYASYLFILIFFFTFLFLNVVFFYISFPIGI